jgi:Leucine-rich repeat (LRR) protein
MFCNSQNVGMWGSYWQHKREELTSVELFRMIESHPCKGEVEVVDVKHNLLSAIPVNITDFPNCRALYATENAIVEIPPPLWNLAALKELRLEQNQLSVLPKEICLLVNLESLRLTKNKLCRVPAELCSLTKLRALCLDYNQLTVLPAHLSRLTLLQCFFIGGNRLPPRIAYHGSSSLAMSQQIIADISYFYRETFMAASTAAVCLLCIRRFRQSDLSVFPIDVVRILGRLLVESRHEKPWMETILPRPSNIDEEDNSMHATSDALFANDIGNLSTALTGLCESLGRLTERLGINELDD